MERKVVVASIIEIIGEYGVVKVKEETIWDNGRVFGRKTFYDVCLEYGDGDIVASFTKLTEARKWAKDN